MSKGKVISASSARNWHAFNWNGEHASARTKRELVDSLGYITPIVRRYGPGAYEVSSDASARMWFVYSSLARAEADGFRVAADDEAKPT